MEQGLLVDSINYGYLPGVTESQRAWYMTLRQPPPHNLKLGSVIILVSYENTFAYPYSYLNEYNNTIFPQTTMYHVIDIDGVNLEVEPITSNNSTSTKRNVNPLLKNSPSYIEKQYISEAVPSISQYNDSCFNLIKDPTHPVRLEFCSNMASKDSLTFPRAGHYLYAQRPQYQITEPPRIFNAYLPRY